MNSEKSGDVWNSYLAQRHFYRTVLCDLLVGRVLRGYAEVSIDNALALEKTEQLLEYRMVSTEEYIDDAVHWEWMARQAEQGNIAWGGRFNRCGYQPKTDE